MTQDRLAWVIRTLMVASAAVASYLLAQTEMDLLPPFRVFLTALLVTMAAISPSNLASKSRTP